MYTQIDKALYIDILEALCCDSLQAVGGREVLSQAEAKFYIASDNMSGFGVGEEGCVVGLFIKSGSMEDLLREAKVKGAEYGMVTNEKVLANYLKYNTKIVEQHKDVFGPGKHWTKITWI